MLSLLTYMIYRDVGNAGNAGAVTCPCRQSLDLQVEVEALAGLCLLFSFLVPTLRVGMQSAALQRRVTIG